MKKVLAVTAALVVAVAPAAHANHGAYRIQGGCTFTPLGNPTITNGVTAVAVADVSVTTRKADGTPVQADVYCRLLVNGVPLGPTGDPFSGVGVQAGVRQASFVASDTDVVQGCQSVVYDYGAEVEPTTCVYVA